VTSATGVGSLPGTDSHEWSRTIAGELPDLPHVPELPARGPGADTIGRTASLLAQVAPDLAVDTTPSGWRFADAPGRVMARAASWLSEDLDGVEEALAGTTGPVKGQLVGPWTLAASIETRNGERAIRDAGACRDLAEALAVAADRHVREIQRRLPRASVVLQFDEPALPTALAGGVSTASGIATYRAVDVQRAESYLRMAMDGARAAGASPGIHCRESRTPVELLRRAGADFVSIDLTVLDGSQEEALGRIMDQGGHAYLGVVPALAPSPVLPVRSVAERAAQRVLDQCSRWGFTPESVHDRLVLTPQCGLAGADPVWVRAAYSSLREAVRLVREDAEVPEESS